MKRSLKNKSEKPVRILRVYVSAWLLTLIAVVWISLSAGALRWLSKVNWKVVGPMKWLSLGLLVAQVLFTAAAARAWKKRKKEDLIVDTGCNRSFLGPFVLGYGLYYLSKWMSGWLSIIVALIGCASLVVATVAFSKEIRRQRRLLSEKKNAPEGK